jgi:fucose permease
MMAGKDAAKLAAFNEQWKLPHIRFAHRLITFVWGCAFVGEFLVRVVLALTLPPALVLAFAPIITNGVVVVMLLWTFAYVRYLRRKSEAPRG